MAHNPTGFILKYNDRTYRAVEQTNSCAGCTFLMSKSIKSTKCYLHSQQQQTNCGSKEEGVIYMAYNNKAKADEVTRKLRGS